MKAMRIVTGFVAVLAILSCAYAADLPKLPSGPPGPAPFGAVYAHLKYSPEWDKPWRVGDHPDVVVSFDDGGHKFVFWRGTSMIPCWVTDQGAWYTNEFVERRGHHSPNTNGCVEPMSDKQCRFSHVRIIESTDARVVIHWRYAPIDVRYEHPFVDPETGWSDWVDEYYTIYPDASGVRKITAHTNRPDLWMEFQESIVINQPGRLPDQNVEYGAVSVSTMDGEEVTYVWDEDGGPDFTGPEDANILVINLKGSRQTYAIVAPPEVEGRLITTYKGHGRRSHFNWWDHWPVAQEASDGHGATTAAKPSHSSLCHIALHEPETWKPYELTETSITKIMMHGMSSKKAKELIPLAKSWLDAPKLKVASGSCASKGYDPTQMAYVIECKAKGQCTKASFELAASKKSPAINPAIVLKGWCGSDVKVKVNGENLTPGKGFRSGINRTIDGNDLIVWIKTESTKPLKVEFSPAG